MESLATLAHEEAATLTEKLRHAGIPFETREIIEEGGVAATELFVEETVYRAACDIVDGWLDEGASTTGMICPKCHSPHLEPLPHESVEVSFRCRDCGLTFVAQA